MHTSNINDFKDKGYSPTNPSFYNLQMYSNSSSSSSSSIGSFSQPQSNFQQPQGPQIIYQNLQEVPYHRPHNNYTIAQPHVDLRQSANYSPPSSVSNNGSFISQKSTNLNISGNNRHVRKGSIVFVNPFTSIPSSSNEVAEVNHINSHNHNHNIYAPVDNSSDSIHYQPIYATFGKESVFVTCPYCHYTDDSDLEPVIGSTSLLWACIIPGLGFLLKSKRDIRHRCKNCLNVIGTHFPK